MSDPLDAPTISNPAPRSNGASPGGGSPSPDPSPPAPTDASDNLDIAKILADKVNVGNNVYDIEVDLSRAKLLSRDSHFELWTGEELNRHTADAVFELEEIRRLEEALGEHRLLLITGEEEM